MTREMVMQLRSLLQEYLLTLDADSDEELYMSDREFSDQFIERFIKWLEARC